MSPLIEQILQQKSVSFVGMEKNTGKTECLNYVLRELYKTDKKIAVTSIGIDGERVDQVTETHKPEIELAKGTIFVTSEKHYKERRPTSNILNVSTHGSTLGRLVTAQALQRGKAIISGPSSTGKLKQLLSEMDTYDVDITLVDGALSRKSFGAPTVTESLILSTGAALSPHLPELIRNSQHHPQRNEDSRFRPQQPPADAGPRLHREHQLELLPHRPRRIGKDHLSQ